MSTSRYAATLAGDDWPLTSYAPPRYKTAPTLSKRNDELGHYAVYLAGEAGLILDPWEDDYLRDSLALRPDQKWGALECGLCVSRQNGKGAASIREVILSTDGWTTIGDLTVGQYVYGSDGEPTRVTRKSPVYLNERCYEFSFADGAKVIVEEDHLWTVLDKGSYDKKAYALASGGREAKIRAGQVAGGAQRTLSTREIAESRWNTPHAKTGRNGYRYNVRCDAVPQTPEADLPIDPYAFGLWLGDGSKGAGALTVGDEDREWMRGSLTEAGLEVYSERRGNSEYQPWYLSFRIPGTRWKQNGFSGKLRQLGVFNDKHIPDCYLTSSPDQRLALLQGLMDTDGSIGDPNRYAHKTCQVEFSSSIPALAETFHVLARSLGIRVTPKWREMGKYKPNCRFLWMPTFNPFRLPRKAARYRPPRETYRRASRMAITGIREVPSVPVQCIQVEADDGIYLLGRHFTPTHNSILEARELVALYANDRKWPGVGARLTVHTAHEAKTAHEGFERLSLLIEGTPRLRAKLRGKPRQSEGGEVIRLLDGRRIRFRTRTSGGGRGLSGDLLLFDEAMILMQGVHEAVWPIVTARENPQIWYTGSAVDKREPLMDEHGIVFARVRKRGIAGDPDLLYMEWSLPYEDPDEVPPEVAADPESWATTNPGLDVRLSRRIITVEQRTLSARGFARERLGVGAWPDPDQSNRVISEQKWKDAAVDETSMMLNPVCYAIDVAPDRSRAAIGVAGRNESGMNQVEVIARFRSTANVVPTLLELMKVHGRRTEIMVDGVGSAASLIPEMENQKLNVVPVTAGEHARGCGLFYDGVMGDDENEIPPTLQHLGDPALNAAVAGATKRPLGDRWAWNRKDSTVDISPLVSVTLALYGFLRKRHGGPGIYGGADLLEDDEETNGFEASDLPPLEVEDMR